MNSALLLVLEGQAPPFLLSFRFFKRINNVYVPTIPPWYPNQKPSIFHCIPKISQIPLTFPIKFLRFSVPPVEIIHGPQGLSAQFANAVGRGDCYLGAVELRMENPFITLW